jgi:type II secretory pathway component PulJ
MLKRMGGKQGGVTLVELMVGSAVGLIVLAAVLASYISVARSASEVLASAKLNAELRAAMDMMVRDIRRAGSWTATALERESGGNPFTRRLDPPTDDGTIHTDITIHDGGKAVVFAYNGSFLGSTAGTVFGYRLDDKAIKTLQCNIDPAQPGQCQALNLPTTGWERLTDENTIVIEALTFSTAGSRCINLTQGGQTWEVAAAATLPACHSATTGYAATTDDRLLERRQIQVRLIGRLKARPEFRMLLEQAVLLPNDRLVTVP